MPSNSAPSLLSRLCADQSDRWRRGEHVLVESYLASYPHIASDPDAILQLIQGEMVLREWLGETPRLEEYLQRFPQLANHLQRAWRLTQLIDEPGPTVVAEKAATAAPASEEELQGYEILEELGKGGMGVVYKARQMDLDRIVAVKLIRSGPTASPEEVRRFRTEARAVARVQHPGVVQVHAFGTHLGCPYLIMEYLPGGSLRERMCKASLSIEEAVRLVRQIARGVQAAHEAGVIHRDLKPSNVLFTVDHQPRVSDFGLARLVDADEDHTRSGAVIGTPAYMAPEQADGQVRRIGPGTDVWALGVILYECLTRRNPFKGRDNAETLQRVRAAIVVSPRKLRPEISNDLDRVCLKCLALQPERRYRSAGELADDLELIEAGTPVAVTTNSGGRFRHSALAMGLLLAMLGATAFTSIQPPPRSDTAPDRIARQLMLRKAVTLIDRNTGPAFYTFLTGENRSQVTRASDNAWAIQSWSQTMVLLVPDPGIDRYRFQAQIRQDRGTESSFAGLFVGHTMLASNGGAVQFAALSEFSEFYDEAQHAAEVARITRQPKPLVPPLNAVKLCGAFHAPWRADAGPWFWAGDRRRGLFKPAGLRADQWRTLRIDVSPLELQVFWNGSVKADITYPVAEFLGTIRKNFDGVRPLIPFRDVTLEFQPRGGLGLYLNDCVVSFRDVRIEPL